MRFLSTILSILILGLTSCATQTARDHAFPTPVDTRSRPIDKQVKKTYAPARTGLYASNEFDGARLNDFTHIAADTFRANINPENTPINHSPYYAFKLWAEEPKMVTILLDYPEAKHRYPPKLSYDGHHWSPLVESQINLTEDKQDAYLTLIVSQDTLWVAAQELQTSHQVRDWAKKQALASDISYEEIGTSKEGRPIPRLHLHPAAPEANKPVVVIISRQHPPEVTGYLAMKAFVEELSADHPVAKNFREKYHVLVYPILNPDGVDHGHWRHNVGGIDLNRDWAYYHQPETRTVADNIVAFSKNQRGDVLLGLDFHSTWNDIFYTHEDTPPALPGFKDMWLWSIEQSLGYPTKESASAIGKPISKSWFALELGAESITYEIGDNTPRDKIREKGITSAREMMKLLVGRK